MSRKPAFAAAFKGRRRIVEMDMIGDDDLDGPHITFAAANGEMPLGALNGDDSALGAEHGRVLQQPASHTASQK